MNRSHACASKRGEASYRNPADEIVPGNKQNHAMSPETPFAVADAYHDALEARDFGLARQYLSDTGFHYRSPVTESSNADKFTVVISRIGPILERIERCKVSQRITRSA
jgi:hypothetical protein